MLKIIEKVYEVSDLKTQKCIVVDISDAKKTEFEVILSVEEIQLIELMNKIQSSCNLYFPIMNELWKNIQAYAEVYAKELNTPKDEQ